MNLRGLFGLHKPALTLDTPMSLREFRTILRRIEQPGGDVALRALARALAYPVCGGCGLPLETKRIEEEEDA